MVPILVLRVVFTDMKPFVETPTLQRINPKYVFTYLDFGGSVVYLISVHIKWLIIYDSFVESFP